MRSWLGIGIAFVAGMALGFLLGGDGRGRLGESAPIARAARAPALAPNRLHETRVDSSRSREEKLLEELRLEISTLNSRVNEWSQGAAPESQRVAIEESASQDRAPAGAGLDPALSRWMVKIEAGLESLMRAPCTLPVIRLPAPGVRPRPLPVPAAGDEDQAEFAASHLLWSYQDVVNSYGRPDVVHDADEWEYKYQGEPDPELSIDDVHFVFSGGYVVQIYAH